MTLSSTASSPSSPRQVSPATARAVWFTRPRRVAIRAENIEPPGSGSVRIRTIASAVSHGTEMLVYRGQVPADLELDLPTLAGGFGYPIKYGYATVGRVVEVGSDVEEFVVGDVVFVHHPHQTEFVVPARTPVRLPSGLPPEQGVFFANLETAVNVLLDAHPRFGDRVAIFGQGVVGLLVTQLLRLAGVERILAIDSFERRRSLARMLGADDAVAPGDGVVRGVQQLTGGNGADIAIEASGNPAALAAALDCVAFQGTIVVCSWYGTKPVPLPLGESFHRRRLRIVSSQVGTVDPALGPGWNRERRAALACNLLSRLQLAPLISHRIPFDRASEAYELVDSHPEGTVQVVLTYEEADV